MPAKVSPHPVNIFQGAHLGRIFAVESLAKKKDNDQWIQKPKICL